ncbi:MAG: hypothetical protein HYZ37_07030 [Candidatus Solibacter usitatus]|nr:hypothetical protein [Candidatus Solibacter usitatus]
MRIALAILTISLAACGEKEAPKKAVQKKTPVTDESQRFPKKDLVDVKIVEGAILGKEFLGGGNLAKYRKGKTEFELFLVKAAGPEASSILMFDYKKQLANAKFIAHFGGYFGKDGDRNVFLFAKGPWLAGIAGLAEQEADAVAREFAARLN